MKLLISALFLVLFGGLYALSCKVSAESAILINAETGATLFEKNASQTHYPASITKVATALYVLQKHSQLLDNRVTACSEAIASISPSSKRKNFAKNPAYWLETDGSHIAIKKDEEMVLRDLMYALLVASANDAANVIAQYIGDGSITVFMKELNAYLKEIGCKETNFLNPHGLHHPDHCTSARDMALITKEAMKIPLFKEIVSTKSYICPKTNKQPLRTFIQTNQLLKKGSHYYDKAIGVKTGYTSTASHCLIAAAKHDDRTLIAVVMGCPERKDIYKDVKALFEAAFSEKKIKQKSLQRGLQRYQMVINGAKEPLRTTIPDDVEISYYPSEKPKVTSEVVWNNHLKLPIKANWEVGKVIFSSENGVLQETPLYAFADVKPTLWFTAKTTLSNLKSKRYVTGGSLVAGLACVAFGAFWWMRSRRRVNN